MVTSPINPMRYWKLEEIQSMLNQIEGYENVVIEFQYTPSEGMGWHSDHYDCTCGIKEQLVNGQWNWLLKYKFQINDKNELGEARSAAFQEMAERLVTDVWRTSINSFRKQQRELNGNNQFKIALEKMNKTPMNVVPDPPTPSVTKIGETTNKNTNTTQTNKTWWTETKLWTASSIIVMGLILSAIYFTKALLIICLVSLVAIFVGLLVAGIYVLIKDALGLDDK
jgi:hypothetical protein